MRWLWVVTVFIFAQGKCATETYSQIPSPESRLSIHDAMNLYHSFEQFISRHRQGPPLPLPNIYVRCLERILLEFPDERFLHRPKGLGLPERVERGYARSWLVASYMAEGKWDDALTLMVQHLFVHWVENLEMKSGLLYGFPVYPYPDPFQGDPPRVVLKLAKEIKEMQEKGAKFSPLLFIRSWCLRARWKGSDPNDALVSFNDLAYALGNDRWQEIIQRDWKAWRFTISVKGKTITFAAESQKAVIEGKEVTLRYPVERSFYDLYVPLSDLVKILGGTVRPPKPEELTVFQRHLPVSLLVVDLD